MQGAWIVECLEHMKNNKFTLIEPTQDAEDRWVVFTHEKSGSVDFFWSKQVGDEEVEIPRYFSGGVPVISIVGVSYTALHSTP